MRLDKNTFFSQILIFLVLFFSSVSTIGGSTNIIEREAAYIYSLQKKSHDITLVASNEMKDSSYYYGSNYLLPFVYSALGSNKSYLVCPSNDSEKTILKSVINGKEITFNTTALSIDDDGHRDFSYIGFECVSGRIKQGKANPDDCYISTGILDTLITESGMSRDNLLSMINSNSLKISYNNFDLSVLGVLSDKSTNDISVVHGSFIAIEWQTFKSISRGNAYYCCKFGVGQTTIYSYLSGVHQSFSVNKNMKYTFDYVDVFRNAVVCVSNEATFFPKRVLHPSLAWYYVCLVLYLASICALAFSEFKIFKRKKINTKHTRNLLVWYACVMFLILFILKVLNGATVFGINLLLISLSNVVFWYIDVLLFILLCFILGNLTVKEETHVATYYQISI